MKVPAERLPIWVVVPTWNEAQNIPLLVRELLALPVRVHVLIVDDDSPDGTWRVAQELALAEQRVRVLHRAGQPRGRGHAGLAGFRQVLAWGARTVVEMDGDLSHQPRFLPRMLAALECHDLVVGSRAVPGGEDRERSRARTLISRSAAWLIRTAVGVPVSDPTSGYRVFTAEALAASGLEHLEIWGPSVVVELLARVHRAGFRIGEVPIEFAERHAGVSTFRLRVAADGLLRVARLGARRWVRLPR